MGLESVSAGEQKGCLVGECYRSLDCFRSATLPICRSVNAEERERPLCFWNKLTASTGWLDPLQRIGRRPKDPFLGLQQ